MIDIILDDEIYKPVFKILDSSQEPVNIRYLLLVGTKLIYYSCRNDKCLKILLKY